MLVKLLDTDILQIFGGVDVNLRGEVWAGKEYVRRSGDFETKQERCLKQERYLG